MQVDESLCKIYHCQQNVGVKCNNISILSYFIFFFLDLFLIVDLEKAVDLFTLLVNLMEGMYEQPLSFWFQ